MGFVRRVPSSVGELETNVEKLYQNRGHIGSVKVNESNGHLEVDLDWVANRMGGDAGQDFFLPIKRSKLREAKELVEKMLKGDFAPSRPDIVVLYDFIDPQGQ